MKPSRSLQLSREIDRAAQLTAIAEELRADRMRGAVSVKLNELIRLERIAAVARDKLKLGRKKPARPDLQTYLEMARDGQGQAE